MSKVIKRITKKKNVIIIYKIREKITKQGEDIFEKLKNNLKYVEIIVEKSKKAEVNN